MSDITQRVVSKITSGQFILTVACAVTFCWLAVDGRLSNEAVVGVISGVFVHYFKRERITK